MIHTDGSPTIACGAGDDLARSQREALPADPWGGPNRRGPFNWHEAIGRALDDTERREQEWPEYEARLVAFESVDLTADDLYDTE